MKKIKQTSLLLSILSLAMALSASVHGQVIQNNSEVDGTLNGNGAAVPTNLAESATLSGDFTPSNNGTFSSLGNLTNGTLGANDTGDLYSAQSGSSYTATLTFPDNDLGYKLTGFTAITGAYTDSLNQKFTLSYSTEDDPFTFITVGTYTNTSPNTGGTDTPTTLTTALTNLNLDGVADLEFTANNPGNNNAGVVGAYREIEVFGSPEEAPEPSTWAMILGGLSALVIYQRTRQRQA